MITVRATAQRLLTSGAVRIAWEFSQGIRSQMRTGASKHHTLPVTIEKEKRRVDRLRAAPLESRSTVTPSLGITILPLTVDCLLCSLSDPAQV